MMLEVDEESSGDQESSEPTTAQEAPKTAETEVTSEGSQTDLPDELPTDSNWEDVFENTQTTATLTPEATEFESQHSKSETLQDHLLQQLDMLSISDRDHAIAIAIIDSVNKDGYLSEPVGDIYQGLRSQLEDLEQDEIEGVLHRVQNFEPIGVAAQDLTDCLLIQLQQLPNNVPSKHKTMDVVKQHLDLLATHSHASLMRQLGLSEYQLKEIIALIRTLDPKPGSSIQSVESNYIVPDVYVSKKKNVWVVSLNPDITPRLRVNSVYSKMIKRADSTKENVTMREHLQEARWFIKSLHSRNDTLMRVAESIVDKQQKFLDHGAIAMKAMVLRDIADELELHESTISRITTQKYMHTPNGIVEFKYFFSSHVSTEAGGECSATAIKALIKELIGNENPIKPLSDNKITKILIQQGINIARRTVAKYREGMSIPPSNQRKRLL
jgi:RNA polymerase sigma-54 factor